MDIYDNYRKQTNRELPQRFKKQSYAEIKQQNKEQEKFEKGIAEDIIKQINDILNK